jgi:hypothetical protein
MGEGAERQVAIHLAQQGGQCNLFVNSQAEQALSAASTEQVETEEEKLQASTALPPRALLC